MEACTRSIRVYVEIFFKWSCRLYEFPCKMYFLSSVTTFAELPYDCRYHVIIVNSTQLSRNGLELSTITFTAFSSVCAGWKELTFEIFCPNCFLHFACKKSFFLSQTAYYPFLRTPSTNKS